METPGIIPPPKPPIKPLPPPKAMAWALATPSLCARPTWWERETALPSLQPSEMDSARDWVWACPWETLRERVTTSVRLKRPAAGVGAAYSVSLRAGIGH